jgi:uncharacterized protein YjdB
MKLQLTFLIALLTSVLFFNHSGASSLNYNKANDDTLKFSYDTIYIEMIGKKFTRGENVTEYQDKAATGGNTSIRNYTEETIRWKTQGYYQRNRDLGQIFIPKKDTWVKSIVLRTGPTEKAIIWGAPGAEMFMQFFVINGDPVINDNGTPKGTKSTHGFNTNHRTDDYIEGVTYESLPTIYRGVFPVDAPVTKDKDGNILSEEGRMHYMRWSFENAKFFKANQQYGFIIGFLETGPGYRITIANNNQAARGEEPSLDDRHTPYKGGWSFRREGDGTLPPTQIPGDNPPDSDSIVEQLKKESLFWEGEKRFTLSPTSDGFPDVDTYRAFEFYVEEEYTAVEGIQLTEDSVELDVGDEYQLSHQLIPNNANDTTVHWFSTNTSVATVDSQGKVNAVNPGTVVLSVSSHDWMHHATAVIKVNELQSSIDDITEVNQLFEVYPNPFSKYVKIVIPNNSSNKLFILDQLGQRVRVLEPSSIQKNVCQYEWDGRSSMGEMLPSGIYYLKNGKIVGEIIKIN